MGLTEEFVVLRAPCTIPFRKDEGVPPPLSVFHGEYSPHSLLIAEANWTQEKSEDKVPMQSRGTLVTPVKDPNGMGLVWEGFLVAVGMVLNCLRWKEPAGKWKCQQAWGPGSRTLQGRTEYTELSL